MFDVHIFLRCFTCHRHRVEPTFNPNLYGPWYNVAQIHFLYSLCSSSLFNPLVTILKIYTFYLCTYVHTRLLPGTPVSVRCKWRSAEVAIVGMWERLMGIQWIHGSFWPLRDTHKSIAALELITINSLSLV